MMRLQHHFKQWNALVFKKDRYRYCLCLLFNTIDIVSVKEIQVSELVIPDWYNQTISTQLYLAAKYSLRRR